MVKKGRLKFGLLSTVEFIDAPGLPFQVIGFSKEKEQTRYLTHYGWVEESELKRSKVKLGDRRCEAMIRELMTKIEVTGPISKNTFKQ